MQQNQGHGIKISQSSVPDMLLLTVNTVRPLHSLFSVKCFPVKSFLISPTYRLKTRSEKRRFYVLVC